MLDAITIFAEDYINMIFIDIVLSNKYRLFKLFICLKERNKEIQE